ncbi:MAG: Asp-tRNA(Asn)/Glu-tRNA(Gln) amidotransferase subunit GatB [Chloroflexota bacterium]
MKYEPVIGLEIHAELLTQSKMFCSCAVVDSTTALPNRHICPVCTGQPGALPVINARAVELSVQVGLALNCEIHTESIFARKNYFYPDLPKGYQISQYELPLATNGWLDIDTPEGSKRIRVRRVHIEEDTGKLSHIDGRSLVDYNRSGVPLLEIVTEPDLRSAADAVAFAVKLRAILRYLGVNTGDMEKGVIRFESNVSVRPAGSDILNTRTEIKNLNSFRSLLDGTEYEIERQAKIYDAGGAVDQETLGFNEVTGKTYSQRGKENAHDYRYFPEPDLPPLVLDPGWIQAIQRSLPELPDAKRQRFIEMGLTAYTASVLIEEKAVADYFDRAVEYGQSKKIEPKSIANWLSTDLFARLDDKSAIEGCPVTPHKLVDLIALVAGRTINAPTARAVLDEMFTSGKAAAEIVREKGLSQVSDQAQIREAIRKVLEANPGEVEKFLAGKESLAQWFFGQVMRSMGGKADPTVIRSTLDEILNELKK